MYLHICIYRNVYICRCAYGHVRRLTSSASRFPAPSIPEKVLVYVFDELAACMQIQTTNSINNNKINNNNKNHTTKWYEYIYVCVYVRVCV